MREVEPPKLRTSILETSQQPRESNDPLKEINQNHVYDLPAVSAATTTGRLGQSEESPQVGSGEGNRLSNGLDPHQVAAAAVVTTNHSPRSSARLSALSTNSNTSLDLPTEKELSTTGEESSMEVVNDSESRQRHESARSISEETRELDEFLNRSSVTSVLTESQISSMSTDIHHQQFERIGEGGASSEENLVGGGGARDQEESMVSSVIH